MLGIICAMESELQEVLKYTENQSKRLIGTTQIHFGTIHNEQVAACLSGVGKVNAAMATTILCQLPELNMIINVGVAGGLKQEQNVCDLVISDEVIQADFDTSPIDGQEGIGLRFPVRKELVEKAVRIAENLNIPYHVGAVATQDLFMARKEDFNRLMKRFAQSTCSEMEGGAIAQVADAFQVPFLVLRTLSDIACHDDNPMEFSKFTKMASEQAANVINAWCAIN